MKKKWLAVLLTGAMIATAGLGGAMTAFAGITQTKPAGDGLTDGTAISSKFVAMNNADPSSYEVKAGDYSLRYKGDGAWQEAIVGTPVPKETMAKENVKVTLMYNFLSKTDAQQVKLVPAAHSADEGDTYGFVLSGNNTISWVEAQRTAATDDDPTVTLHGSDDGNAFTDTVVSKGGEIMWQCRGFASTLKDCISAGGENGGWLRFEMTLNNGWVDVAIQSGYELGDGSLYWNPPQSKVDNWAPYDGSYDFHANFYTTNAPDSVIDGAKLEVSYTEDGDTKNEVLFESNLDDATHVITEAGAAAQADCFIARGVEYAPFSDSEVLVTNPQQDFRFVTADPLKAGAGLANAFDMTAAIRLLAIEDDVKVGIAYGLTRASTLISAPSSDVSFLYLKKDGAEVKLGVDNINAEGHATQVGDLYTVADATVGDDAAFVTLTITGKSDGTLLVKVNQEAEEHSFPNTHLNGCVAFTHTGDGNVTYGIKSDSVSLTGYKFVENVGTEVVTSNFNGNYINLNKFDVQSKQDAITTFMTEDATHKLSGLTPDDGKIGFYGTGTNTRLMFQEKYADFVLQFDYTSFAFKDRAQLAVGGTGRYSPLYILFGIKGEASIVPLNEGYALGVVAGNNSDFYGLNESIIVTDGKLQTEGIKESSVLSKLKTVAADQDDAIALWSGTSPTGEYAVVDTETGYRYSLYNKTSRIKLVVVNNTFTLYVAPIQENGSVAEGAYVEAYKATVTDASGFVGFATDVPGWCAIDNVAITPVAKEKATTLGLNPTLSATEIVADILPEDMANDPVPTPLAKPKLSVEGTKVKWNAVDGAKEYNVTVKLGTEEKLSRTVEGTEIDLSSLTEAGSYTVKVEAVPEDADANLSSNETVTYTVAAQGGGTEGGGTQGSTTPGGNEGQGGNEGTEPGEGEDNAEGGCAGCGASIGGWTAGALVLIVVATLLVILPKKRKNK